MPKKPKKKKQRKTITIDITNLFPELPVPKNMRLWNDKNPMSKKCKKKIDDMSLLIAYIAKQLNTTSEFKNNIAKRVVVLKCLISLLSQNTFMDNFYRYGVLHECMNEIHMRQHSATMMLLTPKQAKQLKKPSKRKDAYIS